MVKVYIYTVKIDANIHMQIYILSVYGNNNSNWSSTDLYVKPQHIIR